MFQIPPGFQIPSDFDQVDTTDIKVITKVNSKTKVITKVDSKTKVIRIKVVKFSADINTNSFAGNTY